MFYTILFITFYFIIHYNWINTICKYFITVLPLLYYFLIKTMESSFNCGEYHFLTTPIRIINKIYKFFKSI